MKTLIALIITLASLSTLYAVEPVDVTGQATVERSFKEITVAFANTTVRNSGTGECTAIHTHVNASLPALALDLIKLEDWRNKHTDRPTLISITS